MYCGLVVHGVGAEVCAAQNRETEEIVTTVERKMTNRFLQLRVQTIRGTSVTTVATRMKELFPVHKPILSEARRFTPRTTQRRISEEGRRVRRGNARKMAARYGGWMWSTSIQLDSSRFRFSVVKGLCPGTD